MNALLPELNTNYGPDMAKVAVTAKVMNEMEREKATQNALANLGTEGGSFDYTKAANALAPVNPEAAFKYAQIGSALDKSGPEAQYKAAQTQELQLKNLLRSIAFVRANPASYPKAYIVAKKAGMDIPHPSEFVTDGQIDTGKLNEYLDSVEFAALDAKDKMNLNKPTYHSFQQGEEEVTVRTTGKGDEQEVGRGPKFKPETPSKELKVVQDEESPTGFSYQDLDGNKIQGAPTPKSAQEKTVTPFQAAKRISEIHQAKFKIETGQTVDQSLIDQFPILSMMKGGQATPEQKKQVFDALDREAGMLEPYAKEPTSKKPPAPSPKTSDPASLLQGKQAGKYKINGQTIKWDGSQVIE